MLSLKKFLDSAQHGAEMDLDRVASILLKGIALYTFAGDPAQFSAFQGKIEEIRRSFEKTHDEDEHLLLAGKAVSSLEEYGRATSQLVSGQRVQMREVIRLLTESLGRLSSGSEKSLANLKAIEAQLEIATRSDEIAEMQKRLKSCLGLICGEAERQNRQQAEIQAELEKTRQLAAATHNSGAPAAPAPLSPSSFASSAAALAMDVDSVTGLPGSLSAAEAIRALFAGGPADAGGVQVVVFTVERIQAINLRFGFQVGDRILLIFAQHLAQSLGPDDLVFRWRGPSFVLIVNEKESVVAGEMKRIAGIKLQQTIAIGEREITVPVTGSWSMIGLAALRSNEEGAEGALRRVEEFAAGRTRSHAA